MSEFDDEGNEKEDMNDETAIIHSSVDTWEYEMSCPSIHPSLTIPLFRYTGTDRPFVPEITVTESDDNKTSKDHLQVVHL